MHVDENNALLIDEQIKLLVREILVEKYEAAIVARIKEKNDDRRTETTAY
jgi:hypothetical protein